MLGTEPTSPLHSSGDPLSVPAHGTTNLSLIIFTKAANVKFTENVCFKCFIIIFIVPLLFTAKFCAQRPQRRCQTANTAQKKEGGIKAAEGNALNGGPPRGSLSDCNACPTDGAWRL